MPYKHIHDLGLITFVLACKIIAKIKIIIHTRCNVNTLRGEPEQACSGKLEFKLNTRHRPFAVSPSDLHAVVCCIQWIL